MSIDSLTRARARRFESDMESPSQSPGASMPLELQAEGSMDRVVRRFAQDLGFQREAEKQDGTAPPASGSQPDWILVSPGMVMRASDYQERFSNVDLEALRERMSLEKFAAFVRRIGAVRGKDDLDVVDMARVPEDR